MTTALRLPAIAVPRAPQLPALTGLRGAGAFWVLLHHWNLFQFGTGKGFHALSVGYLGVDLFFLLSGFIMSHSRAQSFQPFRWEEYGRFLRERITRLYPTNGGVLIVFLGLVLLMPDVRNAWPSDVFSMRNFVVSILLVQSWLPFGAGSWVGPAWTVSLEMGAYATLPALLFLTRRITSPRLAFWGAMGSLVAFVAILVLAGERDPNVKNLGGLLRVAFEFSAGALLYQARRCSFRLPAGAALAAVVLLVVTVTVSASWGAFPSLPAFALLILLGAQDHGIVRTALAGVVSQFLGRISYSLYLVHWPVLVFWRLFDKDLTVLSLEWWALNVALIVFVLGLATVVHYIVEVPSHRWARRVGRQTRNDSRVVPRVVRVR